MNAGGEVTAAKSTVAAGRTGQLQFVLDRQRLVPHWSRCSGVESASNSLFE